MASFRNTLLSGRFEASYGRIVDQFYIRAVRRQQPNWMPPSSYQSMNDAVDSEIVHCAVHGVKRDGRRKSVVILSNERIRNWRPRCSRYLGAISLLNDWEVQASHPPIELAPGFIFQVKETGEIAEECIEISTQFDLAAYRLTHNQFLRDWHKKQ